MIIKIIIVYRRSPRHGCNRQITLIYTQCDLSVKSFVDAEHALASSGWILLCLCGTCDDHWKNWLGE